MDRFERLASALRRIPGLEVRENEPMKRHTTFRIGGHRGWNRPFFPGKRQQSAGGRPWL